MRSEWGVSLLTPPSSLLLEISMPDINEQPPTPKEIAELVAADRADTTQPSHYHPVKRDVQSEADARRDALASGGVEAPPLPISSRESNEASPPLILKVAAPSAPIRLQFGSSIGLATSFCRIVPPVIVTVPVLPPDSAILNRPAVTRLPLPSALPLKL